MSRLRLFLLGLVLISFSNAVYAQATQTSVVGHVVDAQGASIPGATVSIINIATGISRTVVSDGNGEYLATALNPGKHDVKAELSGFSTAIRRGVSVQSGDAVRVDFTLPVGGLGEEVEVVASATTQILRTEDATLGSVFNEDQVQGLPVKGRNFLALAQMASGATEAVGGNQNSLGRNQPLNLSVHGQRMFDNNIRLDGVSLIAGFANGSTFTPSLDMLKEVVVQTGQYGAAYGMYSGAQVDMVLKSGQNDFHGSAFYYLKNDALQSKGYFDANNPPPFDFGQFGATLGGPIKKNKTFFFVGYDGVKSNRQTTGSNTAATAAMRNGDFSALTASIKDPFTGVAFPGNVIPASRISSQAKALMAYIPLPTSSALSNNYLGTSTVDDTEHQVFARIDHQLSPSTSLFARSAVRYGTIDTIALNPNFKSFGKPQNQNFVLGLTKIVSPQFVMEARASYVRESTPNTTGREGTDIDFQRDFGISGLNQTDPLVRGIPAASITGFIGTGETFANPRLVYLSPELQVHTVYQAKSHSLKTGIEVFKRQQDFYSVNASNQGAFNFTGILSGNSFADFLLGLPDTTTRISTPSYASIRQKHLQAYVQDDWRVSPKLTLNLGVRYEYAGAVNDALGISRSFDLKNLALFPAVGSTDPLNKASHDVVPRASLAYRWTENTVLRAGYGIYLTQPTMANITLLARNPPANLQQTFNTVRTNPNLTLANPFPGNGTTSATPTITAIPEDYGPGRAQSWSANIQHRLPGGWVSEVGYVGSKTADLDYAWSYNTPPPGAGAVQARRPFPQFGDIRIFDTGAMANYRGLEVRMQNLDFHRTNILATYSWSRCMDTRSSPATSTVGTEDQEPQDQNNRFDGEWGHCAIDFTHVFKLNAVYRLPEGAAWSPVLRGIAGGWQVGVNVNLHTGPWFNVITSGNTANTSRGTIRPNLVGDPVLSGSDRTVARWFNTSAFAAPAAFTYGNSPRNVLRGPGTKLVDLNLQKKFSVFKNTLEVRADIYNVFNTPQFGIPGRTLGTSTFGQITSASLPREVQLGLRYIF
ncbi:MAG: TonB-dependent receptor [Vicinamibacteria bacterium]